MFREDEGMFYRKINNTKERKETVPAHRRWIRTVVEKVRAKVINVEEWTICVIN